MQEGAVYQDPLPGGTQENPLTLRVEFKNDRFYFTILETQESMQFHIDFFEKSAFCEGNPHRAYRFIQEIWRAIPPRPLE